MNFLIERVGQPQIVRTYSTSGLCLGAAYLQKWNPFRQSYSFADDESGANGRIEYVVTTVLSFIRQGGKPVIPTGKSQIEHAVVGEFQLTEQRVDVAFRM